MYLRSHGGLLARPRTIQSPSLGATTPLTLLNSRKTKEGRGPARRAFSLRLDPGTDIPEVQT